MDKLEKATIAGGCFWCTEAVFQRLKGVHTVVPGYTGGTLKNPTYDEVSTGNTGHAEAIQIEFDPKIISYERLLEVFFHLHDPTTLNKQGNDMGTQYRSAIFYHNPIQQRVAQEIFHKFDHSPIWGKRKIVTEIAPLDVFYPAEAYHENYYNKNSYQPYCTYVIDPKIQKLYKEFKSELKQENN